MGKFLRDTQQIKSDSFKVVAAAMAIQEAWFLGLVDSFFVFLAASFMSLFLAARNLPCCLFSARSSSRVDSPLSMATSRSLLGGIGEALLPWCFLIMEW